MENGSPFSEATNGVIGSARDIETEFNAGAWASPEPASIRNADNRFINMLWKVVHTKVVVTLSLIFHLLLNDKEQGSS